MRTLETHGGLDAGTHPRSMHLRVTSHKPGQKSGFSFESMTRQRPRLLQHCRIAGVSGGGAVEQLHAASRRNGRLVAVVVGQLPQQPCTAWMMRHFRRGCTRIKLQQLREVHSCSTWGSASRRKYKG